MKIFAFSTIGPLKGLELKKARSACFALGKEIGQRNHQFSCISPHSDLTIDHYFFKGIESIKDYNHEITIWRKKGNKRRYDGFADQNIEITIKEFGIGYPITHFRAINEADIAISLGGSAMDEKIYRSLIAFKIPFIIIPTLQGTSKEIWENYEYQKIMNFSDRESFLIKEPWKKSLAKDIVNICERIALNDNEEGLSNKFKKLLSKGKLIQVIDELIKLKSPLIDFNNLIHIRSRIINLNDKRKMGTISNAEETIELNKINFNLIDILSKIETLRNKS